MTTESYLARRAVYQRSHLEGKTDKATDQESQPPEQDAELENPGFGLNKTEVTVQAGSGRDLTDLGK